MRNVKIGGIEYRIMATPITLFYYKKEFHKDLISDFMPMQNMEKDVSAFDGMVFLQMAWAMIKTAGGQIPTLEQWIASLPFVDFEDEEMVLGVIQEAQEGFFRSGEQTQEESKGEPEQ